MLPPLNLGVVLRSCPIAHTGGKQADGIVADYVAGIAESQLGGHATWRICLTREVAVGAGAASHRTQVCAAPNAMQSHMLAGKETLLEIYPTFNRIVAALRAPGATACKLASVDVSEDFEHQRGLGRSRRENRYQAQPDLLSGIARGGSKLAIMRHLVVNVEMFDKYLEMRVRDKLLDHGDAAS